LDAESDSLKHPHHAKGAWMALINQDRPKKHEHMSCVMSKSVCTLG